MLGYGVGARTVDGEGPACNLFSMTGDFQDPFIHNEEELIEAFNQAKAMYENIIISYPNPRYCVIMEVENSDRPLYMCAYQRDDKDESFGFNDVTREELLVEYVKFYTVSS